MFKHILFSYLVTGFLGVGIMLVGDADADVFSQCAIQSDSMRFLDIETNRCGYIFDDVNDWKTLPGGWDDRADQFVNDSIRNLCLYEHAHCGGASVLLPRGFAVTWPNTVSSHRWTTASSCTTSC